jgi:hypothetical protein
MARTTPLLFGIDENKKTTYFQSNGDGTFSAVFPLGTDCNFTYMDAIFRKGSDADGSPIEWIGLFLIISQGRPVTSTMHRFIRS